MSQGRVPPEASLPIELRLLVLEAELERLESDARWVEQRRREVVEAIQICHEALAEKRSTCRLRRVK